MLQAIQDFWAELSFSNPCVLVPLTIVGHTLLVVLYNMLAHKRTDENDDENAESVTLSPYGTPLMQLLTGDRRLFTWTLYENYIECGQIRIYYKPGRTADILVNGGSMKYKFNKEELPFILSEAAVLANDLTKRATVDTEIRALAALKSIAHSVNNGKSF